MNKRRMFDTAKMTSEVALLFERASVANISARAIAADLGIAFNTVYGWYMGRKPLRAHVPAIKAVTARIAAEHPDPEAAVWRKNSPQAEAKIAADRDLNAELAKVYVRLIAKAQVGAERHVLMAAWPGFGEIVAAMRRHGVKFEI